MTEQPPIAPAEPVAWGELGVVVTAFGPVTTLAQPSTVKDEDIPALLRTAIRRLEAYNAPSRPAMLDLASHLRGVLEIPHEAEEAVRRCASLDSNGYVVEKSAVLAALRASTINAPPAPSPVTGALEDPKAFVDRLIDEFGRECFNVMATELCTALTAALAAQKAGGGQ